MFLNISRYTHTHTWKPLRPHGNQRDGSPEAGGSDNKYYIKRYKLVEML